METGIANLNSMAHPSPVLPMLLAAEPFDGLPAALRSEAFAEDLLDDEAYAASSLL